MSGPFAGYPIQLVNQARHMAAAGWTATEISHRLGVDVTPRTILRWVSDGQADRDQKANLRKHRQRGATAARFTLRSNSDEYRAAFINRLRNAGVPRTSIAKVCQVVFDDPTIDRDEVYRALGENPKNGIAA